MSARGRLVKRRIYSAVDKSKIQDKRKIKPKDKSLRCTTHTSSCPMVFSAVRTLWSDGAKPIRNILW